MLKNILEAALKNMKRFFGVWLVILIANQLFIFGACFAPYCLAAALPHTFVIALLINLFGFKQNQKASQPTGDVGASGESMMTNVKPTSGESQPGQSEHVKKPQRHLALLALIPIGVIGALLLAPSAPTWTSGVTSIVAHENAADDVPDTSLSDEHALSEETSVNRRAALETEVDVLDHRAPPEELLTAPRPDSPTNVGDRTAQETSAQQAYQCLNSAGKLGLGTGRFSEEREYSSFLKREVRAGEFVIFKYQGSGKEYWFKASSCSPY